jgi:sugar phosphate isomerase/epimerase
MKLGYSTWGMPATPIDQAIAYLAGLGYTGIEITVRPGWVTALSTLDKAERQRIAGLVKQYNLALPAIGAHTDLLYDEPERHAQVVSDLVAAMDLAVEWAVVGGLPPVVLTTPGGKPEEYEAKKQLLAERLGQLAAEAQARGVIIALEAHIGAVLDIPVHTVEVLHMVNSPHLRLNFDISHFNVMGIPMDESVRLMVPYSVHTHIKDETGSYPNHQFLIPGEGVFDYVGYLRAMQQAGYTGFIVPEISIMRQRQPGYDPLAAAAHSYTVVSQAFREAGLPL